MTALESIVIPFIKKQSVWVKRYFNNKYWNVLLLFSIWITLFDNNSIIRQLQRKYQIIKIDKEISYYNKELRKTMMEERALKHNDEYFEKFVRENYLLKKPNEVIYIFSESKD